jgi:hypothetical protein
MKDLEKFMQVVTNNEFVEGHEVIEDQWKIWKKIPELKEESLILKGLINGSTALALKVKGRDDPANRVWKTFEKYSPLIDSVDSQFTPMYKKARELLHQKYELFFNKKLDL